jgi:hypothetical protein
MGVDEFFSADAGLLLMTNHRLSNVWRGVDCFIVDFVAGSVAKF